MSRPLTAHHPALPVKRLDALLDGAQTLTGLGLAVFLWAHMLLAGSVLLSPKLMNALAALLENSGAVRAGGPLIFALFLGHALLAARRLPLRLDELRTIWTHAWLIRHADTWLWLAQAASGLAILVMGTVHMWAALSTLPITALKCAEALQRDPWRLAFLLFLALLAHGHLGTGLYRAAVKWGLAGRAERRGPQRLLCVVVLVCVGVSALTLARLRFMTV